MAANDELVPVAELLRLLVSLSEKAASLARLVRRDKGLFELLVEEKTEESKNKRFQVDFKTLGDVLIQETVKYFIGKKYPKLQKNVFGEESNKITNKNGVVITITLGPTVHDTCNVLSQILIDHESAAGALAECVHAELLKADTVNVSSVEGVSINQSSLGLWIDPIDGTNQYVKGVVGCRGDGVHPHGLQCVTVLMGMFDVCTGVPLIGVVNQPFYELTGEGWAGRCVWGIDVQGHKLFDIPFPISVTNRLENICVVSSSEDPALLSPIESTAKWKVIKAAGCGYKLLCVIDGLADVFILSRPSSFKWDTCGPHAILKALGGNMVSFKDCEELKYLSSGKVCNEKGIICYSSLQNYHSIQSLLF